MTKQFNEYKKYSPLAVSVMKKLGINPFDEEFKAEATLALIKGIKNYNPEKGTSIETYLYNCLRFALLDKIKHENSILKTGTTVKDRLEKNYLVKLESDEEIPSDSSSPESNFLKLENVTILRKILKKLKKDEVSLLKKRFFEEMKITEIAKELKKSKQAIQQKLKRIFKKIEIFFKQVGEICC